MSRTFLKNTQVAASVSPLDNLAVGAGLAVQTTLEGELDAIRSMLKQLSGSSQWYTDPASTLATLHSRANATAANLATEILNRADAISAAVAAEALLRTDAASAEQSVRIGAEGALSDLIGDETDARLLEVGIIRDALADELTARANADTALGNRIDAETDARVEADILFRSDLNTEISDRGTAVTGVQDSLDAEIRARGVAETALAGLISDEATARGDKDGSLDGDITALNDAIIRHDGTVDFTGNQSMGFFKLTGLGDPTNPEDAANKQYVDSVAQGIDPKGSVKVWLDAPPSGLAGKVVDGINLVDGDRVFLNAPGGIDSGIYVLTVSGPKSAPIFSWDRSLDWAVDSDVTNAYCWVEMGTKADRAYVVTSDHTTVGQTAVVMSQFSGVGTYTSGAGLSLSDRQFSVADGGVYDVMIALGTIGHDKLAFNAATFEQMNSALAFKFNSAGGTVTGDITMGGLQSVTGLRAPALAGDAATKQYVDAAGLGTKVLRLVEGGLFANLQAAVDAAVAGDTILVGPKASGTWGDVTFAPDKNLTVAGIGGSEYDKNHRIGAVSFPLGGPNMNNNEVCISGLYITASTGGAVVSFGGASPARLRLTGCYVSNTGTGHGISNTNTYSAGGAVSSLYINACNVSAPGTQMVHAGAYTYISSDSVFQGGAASTAMTCSAGGVEAYRSLFASSGSGKAAIVVSGGSVFMGYSTVQNTAMSDARGVKIEAGATFGGGDITISAGAVGSSGGHAVDTTTGGIYVYGQVSYPFSSAVVGTSPYQIPLARSGGSFTTALEMNSHLITGLAAPASANDATRKTYVDSADALKVNLTGGTMSGSFKLAADPVASMEATTKQYVDAAIAATEAHIDASVAGLDARTNKTYAVVGADTLAYTNLAGGSTLDVDLPMIPAASFATNCDVFLNGQLLRPSEDVTRGTADRSLQLSFAAKLGDVLCVVQYL